MALSNEPIKEGKYIYCIIDSNATQVFESPGIGGRGDKVYNICYKDISAVISNSPIKKYPISSENTYAHEKAIEDAMKEYTVLPVRFCTIAENEEKIKKILEKGCDKFKPLLTKMKNKKELGLKALFKQDIIYNDILEKYKDIKKLKDSLVSKSFQSTYYERIELGKMVELALEKEKEIYKEEIINTLSPLSLDFRVNTPYGERMIVNAAFLIETDREPEFDSHLNELADKYGDKVKFKYVGTLPPFNFVNLIIELEKY